MEKRPKLDVTCLVGESVVLSDSSLLQLTDKVTHRRQSVRVPLYSIFFFFFSILSESTKWVTRAKVIIVQSNKVTLCAVGNRL